MKPTIACTLCGKTYGGPEAKTMIQGHVGRVHPEAVPDLVAAVAKDPALRAKFEALNDKGMQDHFLRAVDVAAGVAVPPLVFPDTDVTLSTGLRLAYLGRDNMGPFWLHRWGDEQSGVSVCASIDEFGRHVSIAKASGGNPSEETIKAVALVFLNGGQVTTHPVGTGTLHMSAPIEPSDAPLEVLDVPWQPPPKTVVRDSPKIGRNEPCPCGSGTKYKKCHGVV